MTVSEVAFWACGLLLGYTYVGYPLLIWFGAALGSRRVRAQPHTPSVTVVVVARDEMSRIDDRIENLVGLDYPRGRLQILLGSDGSVDDTVERARAHETENVRVFAFRTRRGKPAVLNELVPQAAGDIVVLADARQRFESGALRALVAPFADPSVGAVTGELILAPNAGGTAVGEGAGLYWRYEKSIRRHESAIDSTVGATGAIYAIRRTLFELVPEDTVLDDVLIPLRIARRGYRTLFEPAARAHDRAPATAAEEFRRKVRTIAGNFQLLARHRWLFNPRANRLWFQTLSHKGLRLLTPALLGTAMAANLSLAASPFYRAILAVQLVFYASALVGFVLRDVPGKGLFMGPCMVCILSWATVVAFLRVTWGGQPVTWEKSTSG